MSWSEFELDDLDYISIYWSESPEFLVNEETFLGLSTTDTTFLDTTVNVLTDYYYKINATDLNGVTGSISDEIQGFVYINLPPSLSAIDSQYTIEDQSLEISHNATDPNEEDYLEFFAYSAEQAIPSVNNDTLVINLEKIGTVRLKFWLLSLIIVKKF